MNLSPEWETVFKREGHHAIHWSNVGALNAQDSEIMDWARQNSMVVFTHDLDFGTIIASSGLY